MAHGQDAAGELVAYARRMEADGLAVGTAGNLSVRAGERILITPGGMASETLEPDMLAAVDTGGAHLGGPRPSSELAMHLAAHRVAGVAAVVHTHAPHATAVACVHTELPAVHYLLASLGRRLSTGLVGCSRRGGVRR